MSRNLAILAIVAAAAALAAPPAGAALISEDFSTSASWGGPGTEPAYYANNFIWNSPSVNDTTAGYLVMNTFGGGSALVTTKIGFAGDITVSADVNDVGTSAYNIGLRLGNLDFIFHPGYATGGFRVERVSPASALVGNTAMGYNPGGWNGTGSVFFHHMSVTVTTATNKMDVTIIDGTPGNSSAPFNYSYTYSAGDYTPGTSLVGWWRSSNGQMYVDNFTVDAVPEPATLAVLGLGGLGLLMRRRKG